MPDLLHISSRGVAFSEELPCDIREEGLTAFYYIVGAATSLGRKARIIREMAGLLISDS